MTTTYCRSCDAHHDWAGIPECHLGLNNDRFASVWAQPAIEVRRGLLSRLFHR